MNESLLYGFIGITGLYLGFRFYQLYILKRRNKATRIKQEIYDVLTKEEHKVKGRFE